MRSTIQNNVNRRKPSNEPNNHHLLSFASTSVIRPRVNRRIALGKQRDDAYPVSDSTKMVNDRMYVGKGCRDIRQSVLEVFREAGFRSNNLFSCNLCASVRASFQFLWGGSRTSDSMTFIEEVLVLAASLADALPPRPAVNGEHAPEARHNAEYCWVQCRS
jgi:hypothetical protein